MTVTQLLTRLRYFRDMARDESQEFELDQLIAQLEREEVIEDRTEYRNI